MARITLTDNTLSMLTKMAGGNPGALTVCMRLLQEGQDIDPDNVMGGFMHILALDTHKIYEEKIWMFYKDICGENLVTMVGLLRAIQLGYLREAVITNALNESYARVDQAIIDDAMAKVRQHLPEFAT